MEKKYHVVWTKKAALGRFEIRLDSVLEGGEEYPYSYVLVKDSVGILAFCDGKVILINQYRHAMGAYEIEIPGGAIEDGDSAEDTAQRELIEETGYIPEKMELLGEYYPTPGITAEKCSLFFAKCKKGKQPERESLEYIDTVLMEPREVEMMIEKGKFRHGMGLVAWLMYTMKMPV